MTESKGVEDFMKTAVGGPAASKGEPVDIRQRGEGDADPALHGMTKEEAERQERMRAIAGESIEMNPKKLSSALNSLRKLVRDGGDTAEEADLIADSVEQALNEPVEGEGGEK